MLLSSAGVAQAGQVRSVDVATSGGGVLLKIGMANGLEGVSSFALADPDRIVLDLEGASAGVSSAAGAGGVAKVRIGQFSADVTRLVIDLDRPMTLSEVTADGDRTTLSVMIRPDRKSTRLNSSH